MILLQVCGRQSEKKERRGCIHRKSKIQVDANVNVLSIPERIVRQKSLKRIDFHSFSQEHKKTKSVKYNYVKRHTCNKIPINKSGANTSFWTK